MVYCQECGKPVPDGAVNCPNCNKHLARNSKAWYLLPIFMNIIGGIIMYAVLREKNPGMAKKGLVLGIVLVSMSIVTLAVAASSAPDDNDWPIPGSGVDGGFMPGVGVMSNADLIPVLADARSYVGRPVEIHGEVTKTFQEDGAKSFLFNIGPAPSDMVWLRENFVPGLEEDGCYTVRGNIEGSDKAVFTLTGATIDIPSVRVAQHDAIECIDAEHPAIISADLGQVRVSGSTSVTVMSVHISEDHTRIFVEVENLGDEKVQFYSHSPVIVQDRRQFEDKSLFGVDYNRVESTILPGVIEDGYIILDPIEAGPFVLHLEGHDPNGSHGTTEFEFEIDL